ncbi:MAG TPA: hypothetical protein VK157_13435 [Phycisphaerales bacterium]|nr:hypothetical protein [Phycisphaerales bacterium]
MVITASTTTRTNFSRASSVLMLLAAACGQARAQWTVTLLNPDGPQSESQALAASGTQQVGVANGFATIWNGTAGSQQTIQGPGFSTSQFNAVVNGQQVGWVRAGLNLHAARWSGTQASFVSLHPLNAIESEALATNGSQQGGWAFVIGQGTRAALWNGSASSWIDLSPSIAGSECKVLGMSGSQQVGYVNLATSGALLASLWSGSSASWTNLNPSGSSGSMARAISGTQQVGYATTFDFSHSACVWSGSAGSWVDIGHLATGSDLSDCLATDGITQVGLARIGGEERAFAWNYPTENVTDLHALLPSRFVYSNATGVWSDATTTRVVGWAYDGENERTEAILWTRTAGACTPPSITNQPDPSQVCDGASAVFSVSASGSTPLTYQWQWRPPGEEFFVVMVNGLNIHPFTQQPIFETPSVGAASVTVTPVAGALATSMGVRCYVTNPCDAAMSNLVELTRSTSCCDSIDFNQNTVFPEDQDVIDFFNVLAGGACSPGNTCSDIDFNNNTVFPEDQDVIDFFTVLAGGEC